MAYVYYDTFPITEGARFGAHQLNFLREALSRTAAQVGASITLPDAIVEGTAVSSGQVFHNWLDASRAAIETLLSAYYKRSSNVFTAWTKSSLLTYVHATWPSACKPSDLFNVSNWYAYSTMTPNRFRRAYLNEIYYALECLVYSRPSITKGTSDLQYKDGGPSGSEGTHYVANYGTTVNSSTQSGTLEHGNLVKSKVVIGYQDAPMPTMAITVIDNGLGSLVKFSGSSTVISGSIDYVTGDWSVTTDETYPAGQPIANNYWYDRSTASTAYNDAWNDFEATSYSSMSGDYHSVLADSRLFTPGPSFEGGWWYSISDQRITKEPIIIPNLPYSVTEFWIPCKQYCDVQDGTIFTMPPFTITTNKGDLIFAMGPDGGPHTLSYGGFLQLWNRSFNNEEVDLTYKWDYMTKGNSWSPGPSLWYNQRLRSTIEIPFSGSTLGCYARTNRDYYCNREYTP